MVQTSLYDAYHNDVKLQKHVISMHDFTYKNILNKIDRFIPKKGNVLDVGSATGTISFYLAQKGLFVDGIELSANAFRYANLNKKTFAINNVNFINTTIETYRSNKKYDLVICLEVLEHVVDDVNSLRKIYRLMNKKSVFVISVPSINAPLYRWGFLNNFDRKVGHLRRYSLLDIKQKLNQSNFKIVKSFKTEGLVRNIFFTNKVLGYLLKLTRFKLINNILSYLDNVTLKIFPESQLILICTKT